MAISYLPSKLALNLDAALARTDNVTDAISRNGAGMSSGFDSTARMRQAEAVLRLSTLVVIT